MTSVLELLQASADGAKVNVNFTFLISSRSAAKEFQQQDRMTPSEYSDVRQLFKFAIAHDSFSEISKTCEHLIAGGFQSLAPGYYAMAAGIVTLYGRPFTNNSRIGILSTGLVPMEFKELHSTLINLRHKAFAHTDASGRLPGHGMMTEVRLVFEGRSVINFSSRPILEPVLLPHIKTLSDLLAQKVKELHDTFYDRVLKAIEPRFGIADIGKEFELNVQDEKGPMVVSAKDPIQHKYPVVRPLSDSN
jgi:hypothetical protein